MRPPWMNPGWPQTEAPRWKMEMMWRAEREWNMYGAMVSLPGPEREPATRCEGRSNGGMERCGRISVKVGSRRRDWRRGWVVIRWSIVVVSVVLSWLVLLLGVALVVVVDDNDDDDDDDDVE
jgi:hypothetical protein